MEPWTGCPVCGPREGADQICPVCAEVRAVRAAGIDAAQALASGAIASAAAMWAAGDVRGALESLGGKWVA